MRLMAQELCFKLSEWLLKEPLCLSCFRVVLTAEAVQSATLPLQGVHHIHGGDSFPLGVLGVGDGITDHILQKHLQHPTGLLVDEARNSLHTATTSQATNGGFGDSLDVVTENLSVTLSASFAEPFSALSSAAHSACLSQQELLHGVGSLSI